MGWYPRPALKFRIGTSFQKKTLLELALGRPAGGSQGRGRRGEALPDAGERVGDVQVGEEREPRLGEVVIQRDPEVRAGPHGVLPRQESFASLERLKQPRPMVYSK